MTLTIKKLILDHNLIIPDETDAIRMLSRVNYYRLSVYGIGLKKKDDREQYEDGITLEHLYRLYEFDSRLRNDLLHIIEQIEILLRTQISNYLALKYGAECFIDKNNFADKRKTDGSSVHECILSDFKRECERQKNRPFVKHHMTKYEGHFPIWVAVELFSFGNLSSLYSIMKPDDQKAIADLYHTKSSYLGGWILSLLEVRNICAHYGRLYNMPLMQSPFLYPEYKKYRSKGIQKLFPVILTIKRILKDDMLWESFENRLEALFDEYHEVVKLNFIGFPGNWKEILSKP